MITFNTKERRMRPPLLCFFAALLAFSSFVRCSKRREIRFKTPQSIALCCGVFWRDFRFFFFWSLSKPYLYAPSCLFFNHFCFYLLFVKCSDKVARDVFLFHHPKRRERERERETARARITGHAHTHISSSGTFLYRLIYYYHTITRRERERERKREISIRVKRKCLA